MKIVGVRFENFACFDECYLPFDTGIQILAGKNNSGKTALLRGLTVLNSLPIEPGTQPLDNQLAKYVRGESGSGFDLHILFDTEENDYPTIAHGVAMWPGFGEAASKTLDFHFRIFPDVGIVGLMGAILSYDGQQRPILEKRANQVLRLAYNSSAQHLGGGENLNTTSHKAHAGDNWPSFQFSNILAPLVTLRNVLLVDAHRVVIPELNLQTVEILPRNASSLAPFLDTLHGNNRSKFDEIENFLTRVFPEFRYVNPEKKQNVVSLTLTRKSDQTKIPLSHCGTGVEQVLALATFVLTAPTGSLILLDEPHSYLHPTAEHDVISFLMSHSEHRYFISTHSAIMINAVTADRVISLTSSHIKKVNRADSSPVAGTLHSLGYRNSDFLFSDRLVFVEGESDQEILPILLSRNPQFKQYDIDKTGFPTMGGEGKVRASTKQTSLIHYEKMLDQLGKALLPHIYLFDGDCVQEDTRLLGETPYLRNRENVEVGFLSRREIENYLLVPGAIFVAIQQVLAIDQDGKNFPDLPQIEADLNAILAVENDSKLYPDGRSAQTSRTAKGSVALHRLFANYGIPYNKRTSGRLIAEYITAENQPALAEIWDLVAPIFP